MGVAVALRRRLRIYAITPDSFEEPEQYAHATREAVAGGATAVQYRYKGSRNEEQHRACAAALVRAARELGALAIINDDVDLAERVDADGVHLGISDLDVATARSRLADTTIIGASAPTPTHGVEAVRHGADYLGVGAIFDASPSKMNASAPRGPAWLREFRRAEELRDVPIVAIGGVTDSLARICWQSGADGVASIRGIMGSSDPRAAAGLFAHAWTTHDV